MVTDSDGYVQIIEYLTEHLRLFENCNGALASSPSVMEVIELELSEQIILVCSQNDKLSFNQRNTIIREVDAIVSDLEEILSGVVDNPVTTEQESFLKEFSQLIKNLFDTEIHSGVLS